jgi:hypothetical protein
VYGTCPQAGERTGWAQATCMHQEHLMSFSKADISKHHPLQNPSKFSFKTEEYKLHHSYLNKNNEKETSSTVVFLILCHKH